MGEKNELDVVVEMLTQWVTAVKLRNAVNYTDINRTAENLALRLLNTAYDYNLKNLNWDKNNYPAVDLGDHDRGIAFQVTATDKWVKIKDTVEKFYAPDGPHKEFPGGLFFFFTTEKPPTLSKESQEYLDKMTPRLDTQRKHPQMMSMKELLMRMEELYSTYRQRFLRVKELLEEEWGYGAEKINRRQVLEELYRGSKRYLASLRGGGGRFRYLKISDTLLAPTRKSQRKEWLDTPVTVDGKADELESNDNVSISVLEAIPRLWQEECRHAMLKGEGGMGKTVSFIRLWEQYTASDDYNPLLPVPMFIPLNEYNETGESERRGFIQRLIRRFYLEEKTREKELLDIFREPVEEEKIGAPSVILLLDGLNEVTVERTGLLVELREIIEHWQGVQMLVSSRPDMRDTLGWTDFHLLELKGLGNEQIDKYLGQWGLTPLTKNEDEWKYPLRRLLQNPMMLTIYAASCEVVKEYGVSSYYDFKERVETPGELLWNFMEAQVVKYFRHSGLEERQKYFYKFLLKMLLPALGYEMEKAGRFQLEENELNSISELYLKRFGRDDFLCTFKDYLECSDAWDIDDCKPRVVFQILAKILKILSGEMSMLVKEGQLYRFLHQDFRDFFAAVHILNEVAIGISREEVAEVLTGGMISFYPRRYMAEIEGEHYCEPYLEEGKGWQIKSNDSTLLARELRKCRKNFGEPYAYAVANILESWKQVRGEWSGLNLSQLDFSRALINGTICSRLYKKKYLAALFDESLIPSKSLFPEGHYLAASSAVYSLGGQKILSASWDQTIKEWDVASGTCLRTYKYHAGIVNSASYSVDGQKILSASGDETIKEWDVANGTCLRTYKGHEESVISAVYSANGQKILSASWDQTIKEWNVTNGNCLRTYQGHEDSVTQAIYNSDGQRILSASSDGTIKEWDVANGTCLRTYQGHKKAVTSALYSHDGQKILSGSEDNTIREWDVASGTCLRTYQGHKKAVTSALYSHDGQKILSGSKDNTIREWDVGSGTCLRTYQGHTFWVLSAVYSVDGQKILSASRDETIKEWDVASGTCLRTYQGHKYIVNSAKFNGDGRKIISASDDNTIKEWDVVSKTCLRTYQGHSNWVNDAIYSRDEQKILSVSEDQTIKEWDVASGTCVRTYQGHKDSVSEALYSKDGQKILSISRSGIWKEWQVDTCTCLATWGHESYAPLGEYSDFSPYIRNKLIKIDQWVIKVISLKTKRNYRTLYNIPGLLIHGCSFKNLNPNSQLSDGKKELLKMYGGIVE